MESKHFKKGYLTLKDFNTDHDSIEFINFGLHRNHIFEEIILKQKIVSIDTEWNPPTNTTSIMQISTLSNTYIFDLGHIDDPELDDEYVHYKMGINYFIKYYLIKLFEDENIIKVVWDFTNDLERLIYRFPIFRMLLSNIKGVVDLVNYSKNDIIKGFSPFCEFYLGKGLDKTHQCDNWDKRPLSESQLEYAALDTLALMRLFLVFKNEIKINFNPINFVKKTVQNSLNDSEPKSKLCKNIFINNTFCKFGNDCHFAHDLDELHFPTYYKGRFDNFTRNYNSKLECMIENNYILTEETIKFLGRKKIREEGLIYNDESNYLVYNYILALLREIKKLKDNEFAEYNINLSSYYIPYFGPKNPFLNPYYDEQAYLDEERDDSLNNRDEDEEYQKYSDEEKDDSLNNRDEDEESEIGYS